MLGVGFMGMFVSINSVNLLMVLAITFLASSSAFVGHMGPRRNYRLTCLGAGEGFGSKKEPANEFPSIDAFAKDKEILLRDRSYQATAIPSLDEIQNNGKGQFGEDREKKFDFNDLTFQGNLLSKSLDSMRMASWMTYWPLVNRSVSNRLL